MRDNIVHAVVSGVTYKLIVVLVAFERAVTATIKTGQ